MLAALLLAVAPLVGADPTLPSGMQYAYRGGVAMLQQDRSPAAPEKTFDLTLLLVDSGKPQARVYWHVEERGRGAWPWIERVGSTPVDAQWRADEKLLPSLLYTREEGASVIPVRLPMLAVPAEIAVDGQWNDDPWEYVVQQANKGDGRDLWQVQVSNAYGRKRLVQVDQKSPLIVASNERVFMGMGEEYDLQLKLISQEQLPPEKADALAAAFDAVIGLRAALNRAPRTEERDWDAKQLTQLQELLPAVEKQVGETFLTRLTRTAKKDLELQSGRVDAVGKLAAEFVGQPAPKFAAEGSSKEKLSNDDLQDKVTILHFWNYREPLEEPYGQVAYLDFLLRKREKDGVRVYGVAVDGRLGDEEQRGAALRGIRKLKSFMNLSYPVLLDSGPLIKQFGDPRLVGAELPLFVVIGPDGAIRDYHVGFHEVDRNAGLKKLDDLVTELLKK